MVHWVRYKEFFAGGNMSLSIIHTRARLGIQSPLITVEVHLSNGLPGLSIVGMPETVVKESKDRVRSALINSQFEFPARRTTINLAPADLPKEGSRFDLPIAIGILAASGQIPAESIDQYEFLGELALSGQLRDIKGIFPAAIACGDAKRHLITSYKNAHEAALYDACEAYGANSLLDVCNHLAGESQLTRATSSLPKQQEYSLDLIDVKGQQLAKRALEISAAGGHNLLFYGPPGTGKTMLASRMPGIMPPLTTRDSIEVASIHSLCNHTQPHWGEIPFRRPHHTSSAVALVGGGSQPKPGEISLSHRGVLFLDELAEFPRHVLEVLREPLESGEIHISRANIQVCYPSQFILIAALNPCPCGFFGSPSKKHYCRCSPDQIRRYRQKISGPLLDRIDLHVPVNQISSSDMDSASVGESSATVKARVIKARNAQQARQHTINAQLTKREMNDYCQLSKADKAFLNHAIDKLGLSSRSHDRILKTARTIADLSNSSHIEKVHISEAIALRGFDREKT